MQRIIRRLAVGSLALVAIGIGTTSTSASAKPARPLAGELVGTFFFHECAAGAPEQALCLHDEVDGRLRHLGRTTGSFEVVFDVAKFEDGCGPISKQGSFVAANGDRLDVSAQGTFCFTTLIANYEFEVTGGTGRFAEASGGGSWVVPPPTTFDGVAGVGGETVDGTITRG